MYKGDAAWLLALQIEVELLDSFPLFRKDVFPLCSKEKNNLHFSTSLLL